MSEGPVRLRDPSLTALASDVGSSSSIHTSVLITPPCLGASADAGWCQCRGDLGVLHQMCRILLYYCPVAEECSRRQLTSPRGGDKDSQNTDIRPGTQGRAYFWRTILPCIFWPISIHICPTFALVLNILGRNVPVQASPLLPTTPAAAGRFPQLGVSLGRGV